MFWIAPEICCLLVMVRLELLVDQGFHLVRIVGAERQHAQIVAEEYQRVMVLGEVRELLEEAALLRMLDMAFEREHALGLGDLEDLVEQAEQLDVAFFLVGRALDAGREPP